jgi:hypothetical protein
MISPGKSSPAVAALAVAALALVVASMAACAHPHEAQVVAAAEKRATIAAVDTVDTQRIAGASSDPAVVSRALAELIAAHFATVGVVRAPVGSDVVVELPATGWLLHAHIVMRPELFALVTMEPLAADGKSEHAVTAAPWSVLDAFERTHLGVISLDPPRQPPMPAQRFARLRAEATTAAAADRLLDVVQYRRTPRPISDDPERPYYTPPSEDSILKGAP